MKKKFYRIQIGWFKNRGTLHLILIKIHLLRVNKISVYHGMINIYGTYIIRVYAVLYFLCVLVIPIIIHLFNLQRFKKIEFTNVHDEGASQVIAACKN